MEIFSIQFPSSTIDKYVKKEYEEKYNKKLELPVFIVKSTELSQYNSNNLNASISTAIKMNGFWLFYSRSEVLLNIQSRVNAIIAKDSFLSKIYANRETRYTQFSSNEAKEVIEKAIDDYSKEEDSKINAENILSCGKILLTEEVVKMEKIESFEELISENIQKFEDNIIAYVLCKEGKATEYRSLARIDKDPEEFIQGLLLFRNIVEGLSEKHIKLKEKQLIKTIFIDHFPDKPNDTNNCGIVFSSFENSYELIICYDRRTPLGLISAMLNTIEKSM
jgi:hypothetical protein